VVVIGDFRNHSQLEGGYSIVTNNENPAVNFAASSLPQLASFLSPYGDSDLVIQDILQETDIT